MPFLIGKTTEELVAIDASKITPSEPCACGKEQISVPLNAISEQAGMMLLYFLIIIYPYEFVHRIHCDGKWQTTRFA
jgi:hypothetical protein